MNLSRFTILYLVFTGLLIAFAGLLGGFFPDEQILAPKFWLMFGFLAGITFVAYLLAYLGIKRNPEMGIQAIMISVTVKMIFCMVFVLVYSLKVKANGFTFIANFFSLYLLYSIFEVCCLLRNLRHQNLK